jgi:FAD synthase
MHYSITGRVVRGDDYGKKLGFPTANLEVGNKNIPRAGVYAGNALLEGRKYRAGIVVGPGKKVEAHLIGYNGDAYGKEIKLRIEKFLREYKKFNTEEELIEQIKKDLKLC